MHCLREIHQNVDPFAWFDPPKWVPWKMIPQKMLFTVAKMVHAFSCKAHLLKLYAWVPTSVCWKAKWFGNHPFFPWIGPKGFRFHLCIFVGCTRPSCVNHNRSCQCCALNSSRSFVRRWAEFLPMFYLLHGFGNIKHWLNLNLENNTSLFGWMK